MKYFSMFSGIGGFEYGIDCGSILQGTTSESIQVMPSTTQGQTRFTCIGYSEIDKYATAIYDYHFGERNANDSNKQSTEVKQDRQGGNRNIDEEGTNVLPTSGTASLHIGGHKNYGNATTIIPEELPDFDLLVGGFPCQAFSIAGKRLGFDDTRGTLFFEIARILKVKRPRNFILENVKGLLSHDFGRTFKTIISTLVELGYGVEWQVLNSKNHGVPQNRERVFIVGYLGGEGCGKVFPIGESDGKDNKVCRQGECTRPLTTVYAHHTGKYMDFVRTRSNQKYKSKGITPPLRQSDKGEIYVAKLDDRTLESEKGFQGTQGDMCDVPQGKEDRDTSYRLQLAQQRTEELNGNMSQLPQYSSSPEGEMQTLREADEGVGVLRETLPTNEEIRKPKNVQEKPTFANCRIRRLTPVEAERLQGFPDNWTKYGKFGKEIKEISDSQRYKCLGNAVTTNVVEAVVRRLIEGL